MPTAAERAVLEDALRKARAVLAEAAGVPRKLREQLDAARNRLGMIEHNVEFCRGEKRRLAEPQLVVLYSGEGEGGWLRHSRLLRDNIDLLRRIRSEVTRLGRRLLEAERAVPAAERSVQALEGRLAETAVVLRFPR